MISAPPTADDERVLTLVDNPDPAVDEFHWSLRDFGGKVLRDFLSKPGVLLDTIQQEWIYRGDQLTAMVDVTEEDPQTMYFSLDHLGTTRLETDETGNVVKRWKYFPYGEDASPTAAGEPRLRFTGHERDTYSPMTNTDDLDWMHARFEGPGIGRFFSADKASANPRLPQSLNRFSYVMGNPLGLIDRSGLEAEEPTLFDQVASFFADAINHLFPSVTTQADPAAQELAADGDLNSAQAESLSRGHLQASVQQGLNETTADLGAAGLVAGLTLASGIEGQAFELVSRIGENSTLVKAASSLSGDQQRSVDKIAEGLAAGRFQQGLGTKRIAEGIFEARAANGARVVFRVSGGKVEILARFNKSTQKRVLTIVLRVFTEKR